VTLRKRLEHEVANSINEEQRARDHVKGARIALEHLLLMDDERAIDAQDVYEVLSELGGDK
jgi:hypothetical protein